MVALLGEVDEPGAPEALVVEDEPLLGELVPVLLDEEARPVALHHRLGERGEGGLEK